ncbi:uncharacterized protein LOC18443389 isoform X1 [Amborella trichopoda]|uniref:uncharacterized protein LOC18443389 isoform X1 n=1 Tax=Amborella trichopoda TaxID=13333 RepID=UPI0009C04B2F|nr:uncharacterized protein LOC18443389 isoform X1 [Amborella trichopoda]|eukprot:XP_020528770.1 uncharacterized protein LOC18443389 isoform X1 [Amborella trichopoda]
MASRYRALTRTTISSLKSAMKPKTSLPNSTTLPPSSSPTRLSLSSRQAHHRNWLDTELRCCRSLYPLHSTVASARLICFLGLDGKASRSMSQELGLSVPR